MLIRIGTKTVYLIYILYCVEANTKISRRRHRDRLDSNHDGMNYVHVLFLSFEKY